jgi:hypothetical protein
MPFLTLSKAPTEDRRAQGSTLSIELVAGLISSSQSVVELIARSEIVVELLMQWLTAWVTWWSIFVDLGAIAGLF